MKVDEKDRKALRERLGTVLGEQPAGVLMDLLEPGPEPATSDDLQVLRGEVVASGIRLDGIDSRLDGIDSRLDGIDSRLDGIDSRLDGMDRRFDRLNLRLDQVDTRFEMVDARFEALSARFDLRTTELARTVVFTGIGLAVSCWGLVLVALGFG